MSRIIKIPFTERIDNIIAYGLQEAKSYKGKFHGDVKSGNFDFEVLGGYFKGEYFVKNDVIEIILSRKPFFVPLSVIESFLKRHIK